MQANIQKWGNSLGLRIPMQLAKQMHLYAGSPVTVEIENDRLIIQLPKYDLGEMLDGITFKNQHYQIFDDKKQGTEEW